MKNLVKLFGLSFAVSLILAGNDCSAETTIYQQNFDWEYGWGSYEDIADSYNSPVIWGDDGEWEFTSHDEGQIRIYNWGGWWDGVLIMDDSVSGNNYSLNEGILTLGDDFSNWTGLELSFYEYDSNDEETSLPELHTDSVNADGVSVRATNDSSSEWHKLTDFYDHDGYWVHYDNLDISSALADLDLAGGFQIKFQQYDNYPHGTDGRKFDKIKVKGTELPTPTSTPGSMVPEPASLSLFGIGLVAMYGYRRRKQKQQTEDAKQPKI